MIIVGGNFSSWKKNLKKISIELIVIIIIVGLHWKQERGEVVRPWALSILSRRMLLRCNEWRHQAGVGTRNTRQRSTWKWNGEMLLTKQRLPFWLQQSPTSYIISKKMICNYYSLMYIVLLFYIIPCVLNETTRALRVCIPVIVFGSNVRDKRQIILSTYQTSNKKRLTIVVCSLSLYLNWNQGSLSTWCNYICLATKGKGNTHFILLMAMFHFHFWLCILLHRSLPH